MLKRAILRPKENGLEPSRVDLTASSCEHGVLPSTTKFYDEVQDEDMGVESLYQGLGGTTAVTKVYE